MLYRHFTPTLFFFLLTVSVSAQNGNTQSEAERQADSILRNYFNEKNNDPRFGEAIDSARLEQAENEYMDNFLKLQRDPENELLHKRILQAVIGIALLSGLIVIYKRKRRK